MRGRLEDLAGKHAIIGDIRGRGAMMAIELIEPGTVNPDPVRAAAVNADCHRNGVVTLTCGTWGNVFRFLPPLVDHRRAAPRGLRRASPRRSPPPPEPTRHVLTGSTAVRRVATLLLAPGAPYSVSRSRNGTASNASGPSTPAPDQVPRAISSRATTGLTAVCQTTHWWPYSCIDHSLSTTW